jgi:omega-6 fatty acid desaturase (delta-12 desaturase)
VLAHECGHGGFVAQEWLNDTVGFIFHTALYVPYFSWKFSHAKHHHYTNHMVPSPPSALVYNSLLFGPRLG